MSLSPPTTSLIAGAERSGKTEMLCKDLRAQGKSVFALDSVDKAHLVECGVVPSLAEDSIPC